MLNRRLFYVLSKRFDSTSFGSGKCIWGRDTSSHSCGVNHVICLTKIAKIQNLLLYQVCSFKLNMHQNLFSAAAQPRTPYWGAYDAPPDP